MSLRDLVDPECGGANQLMRLGNQVTRDIAYKDEGISRAPQSAYLGRHLAEDQLVSEFLGQITQAPPQTFRMDTLLNEIKEIDAVTYPPQVIRAPHVIQEVHKDNIWVSEFESQQKTFFGSGNPNNISEIWGPTNNTDLYVQNIQHDLSKNVNWVQDFFDVNESPQIEKKSNINEIQKAADELLHVVGDETDQFKYSEFLNFMKNVSDGSTKIDSGEVKENSLNPEKWVQDFVDGKQNEMQETENYNQQFWNRLQEEWKKISEDNDEGHPWLSEFTNFYDPYKEYVFDENNPMTDIENAFEKGKAFLAQGDIPSAVLCFESAVKQNPENPEIWEYLGTSQAENEKDPNAIAALKKSLELNPTNMKVLMALAVSYTNESLQSQALKMLVTWLKCNSKYQNLVLPNMLYDEAGTMASSLIRGPELREVQNLFLQAVQTNDEIDADIQEALGVLFNLSSEYDKAVDCFRAALQVRADNAKTWNRLGASLANGNRSVEAVEAYQRALHIQPGFIRARYNVGIICINLKAYKEAVEHFLTALNHQATSVARSGLNRDNSSNQMSDTIWSTLRMAISLMGRHDLQPAIDKRDLNILNATFETND